ncbi:MAG: class I SAM-dependent methyltransferase [Gallionellaceae bacterium]|nr:class I SAM-dependent methyltransferase [Gallionellaceae bacterium]
MSNLDEGRDNIVYAPHPPLTRYYEREEDRSGWLTQIFNKTAPDYDRMESILGLGTGSLYRRHSLVQAGLKPGMSLLDVGVGTGLVARQAAHILGDPTLVTGVDPSVGMLHSAKLPAGIKLIEGRAERIPLPDASFDFLSMGYALRHISDLSLAFTEFSRVLKPGGKLCILEITRPQGKIQSALIKTYLHGIVPTLAKLMAREKDTSLLWRYYWDTIEACASPESVMNTLTSVGFVNVRRTVDLGIFSAYLAQKPEESL